MMIAALTWLIQIVVGAAYGIMIGGAAIAIGLGIFLLADVSVRRARSAIVSVFG